MTDLYLQRLVVDDGLLVFEGQLQLLVPLQQRLSQLRRQLQVCNYNIFKHEQIFLLVCTLAPALGRTIH